MNATAGPRFGARSYRRWSVALVTGLLLSGTWSIGQATAQSRITTPIAVLPVADANVFMPSIVDPVIINEAGATVTWTPGNGLDVQR